MTAFSLVVFHTIKFIHVLAAVTWVGGGIFVQVYATRLRRTGDPSRISQFAADIETIAKRLFIPASVTAVIMGIAMVLYAPFVYWSETWIVLGLIGFAATFVTGTFFLGPTTKKIAETADREGPTAPATQALVARIFTISRIDQVVLVLVILDMVFKPGSKALS